MRVLVVDDDEDWRFVVQRALEVCGHEVRCLPSAFGLVNQVAGVDAPRPDLVVLDCMLPGLSGESALELLARDRRTREVPVVLMSAHETERKHELAAAHGRAMFLAKDGKLKSLVRELESHAAVPALARA